MNVYQLLDLTGTFVFADSGVSVAAEKKMDIFGTIVIVFATACLIIALVFLHFKHFGMSLEINSTITISIILIIRTISVVYNISFPNLKQK